MSASFWRYCLPALGSLVVAACPPWMQDDPAAPMAEYRGTKFGRGHAFILAPPPPAVPWDSRIYAPPASVPIQIDLAQLIREAITVFVVITLAVQVASRTPLRPSSPSFPSFDRRTFAVAGLVALITPLPVEGPVAFQPLWLLTDSNHGIPGWLMALVAWALIATPLFFGLAIAGAVRRMIARRRATGTSAPAA
jgi:hypothetical protein